MLQTPLYQITAFCTSFQRGKNRLVMYSLHDRVNVVIQFETSNGILLSSIHWSLLSVPTISSSLLYLVVKLSEIVPRLCVCLTVLLLLLCAVVSPLDSPRTCGPCFLDWKTLLSWFLLTMSKSTIPKDQTVDFTANSRPELEGRDHFVC